jgi:hypothetical protein
MMWHARALIHPDATRRVAATQPGHAARPALLTLSAALLLWNSWRCVSRTRRLRRDGKTARLPETLQTWEGEGGRPDSKAGSAHGDVPPEAGPSQG